ncbi:hypothetical protein [Streptomyces sp. NPDC006307]|uniref:hypothetical protein n=1 Tax=Streptomyces sp. NPDC006307 TaxID=3156748 RepID=UPI0033ABCA83
MAADGPAPKEARADWALPSGALADPRLWLLTASFSALLGAAPARPRTPMGLRPAPSTT